MSSAFKSTSDNGIDARSDVYAFDLELTAAPFRRIPIIIAFGSSDLEHDRRFD